MQPLGPYDLAEQNEYFGEWAEAAAPGVARTVMAFPVEGWDESAAVVVEQSSGGDIDVAVHGARDTARAQSQGLAVLSLDVDGRGYLAVGERDPVIGRLQQQHHFLRPVLFHSPYEAACSFIIGHRIRITQGRAIRRRMAQEAGEPIAVDGTTVHAFPAPQRLLQLTAIPGVAQPKIERLHDAARAALDGWLDRATLRAMAYADAIARVKAIKGLGDFFASGVVLRGAGFVDESPGDEMTLAGVRRFYGTEDSGRIAEIVEGWRPYRTWCSVLVHASERRSRAG
ncbi:MAG: DNA-3-methyladenine glycosylase 2 family protein [Candidatus Dormibacteraeota bacterium]|nr:DNA-3-methyladenine glycosylase 2 family protein [Candidatus Dormibacteraeota bacterium]